MVHGRHVHRPQDPVRHVGRPRNLQKMPTATMRHGTLANRFPDHWHDPQTGANHLPPTHPPPPHPPPPPPPPPGEGPGVGPCPSRPSLTPEALSPTVHHPHIPPVISLADA